MCLYDVINDLTVIEELSSSFPPIYLLQFGARDQDCVLAEQRGIGGTKNIP